MRNLGPCVAKKKYATREEALAAKATHHRKEPDVRAYRCPECRFWHVGHRRQS
jgi:hypothetical protein